MNFDLEDMRQFAERHRGRNYTSGPHWSTLARFTLLFDEYEKAIARAEVAEAMVQWIPVEERLPEERVSVICSHERTNAVEMAYYVDGHWWQDGRIVIVTHWMPLPDPPKEDSE